MPNIKASSKFLKVSFFQFSENFIYKGTYFLWIYFFSCGNISWQAQEILIFFLSCFLAEYVSANFYQIYEYH